MRIAINGRLLIPNKLEGIGFFTWEVIKQMVRLYPDNDYLILFDRKPAPEFLIPGVEFRVAGIQARHPILYRIWFDVLVPWHLRTWDAELFLSFDGFTSRNLSIPVITAIHDLAYVHYPDFMKSSDLHYYQKFQPRFARLSSALLTVSHFSKNDIVDQYDISPSKIHVVYNGSRFEHSHPEDDPELLSQYDLTPGAYFIYAGSLHPRKNIIRLIQGFEQFSKTVSSEVKLVLAGRSAWKTAAIDAAIEQSGISDRIVLTGYISDPLLWNLMTHSLALCNVSLFEGFGVPVLDAFHAGVPVICSNTTSLTEIAEEAAVKVDPHDVNAIASALAMLHNNEGLRQGLIKKGNQQKLRYSWAQTSQVIYQVVCEVYENEYERGMNPSD